MKYKVGDRVKVREDLVNGGSYKMESGYDSNTFVGGMINFKGKIVTISRVNSQYSIEECDLSWTDGMFECLESEIKPIKKETKEMEKKETIQQLTKREKGRKIKEMREKLGIEKTMRNGNALIVWFKDGTKVVEKASVGDVFDYEIGIALAYVHYLAGSKSIYKRAVDKITDTVTIAGDFKFPM